MARRVPPQQAQAAPDGTLPPMNTQVPAPAMPGGSFGMIPEASKTIRMPGPDAYAAPSPAPVGEVPKIARYVIEDCPKPPNGTPGYRVVLNGCLAFLADGKTVDGTTYDIDMLRRQGVKLRHLGDF